MNPDEMKSVIISSMPSSTLSLVSCGQVFSIYPILVGFSMWVSGGDMCTSHGQLWHFLGSHLACIIVIAALWVKDICDLRVLKYCSVSQSVSQPFSQSANQLTNQIADVFFFVNLSITRYIIRIELMPK